MSYIGSFHMDIHMCRTIQNDPSKPQQRSPFRKRTMNRCFTDPLRIRCTQTRVFQPRLPECLSSQVHQYHPPTLRTTRNPRQLCGVCPPSVSKRRELSGKRQSRGDVRCVAAQELAQVVTAVSSRDVAALGFTALGSFIWVKVFDLLAARELVEQKLSRKLVHITTGPLFALCWCLFSDAPYARFLAAIVPMANLLRLSLVGSGVISDPGLVKSMSREGGQQELLRGPLYYIITLLGVTMLSWRDNIAGMLVLSVMCGGDGLADVVGRRLGKHRLPHNSVKSWEGSLAMFLGGVVMTCGLVSFYQYLGYVHLTPEALIAIMGVSFLATVIESLPINAVIDDNLSVPFVTALSGYLALQFVA